MSQADAASQPVLLHASCVALSPHSGLLIMGPSGSGKSSLALMLMAFGARLVSDDQVKITRDLASQELYATAAPNIEGMIEARGLGILRAETLSSCVLRGIVDMALVERDRLPPLRKRTLIGTEIPVFHRVEGPQFAPALIQWLKGGCA